MKKYYHLRRAGKNRRKTFSILEEIKNGPHRKFQKLSEQRIHSINANFLEGKLSYQEAEKQFKALIKDLREKERQIEVFSFSQENEALLANYWQSEYLHRDVIWQNDAKNEFKRALRILGAKSLYTISSIDLQKLIDDTYPTHANNHRRMTAKLKTLLRFIGRKEVKLKVRKKQYQHIKFLSDSEFNKLISIIKDKELITLISLAFYSGCRIGEIYGLEEYSLKDDNTLIVAKQIDKLGRVREVKNRKPRHVFLRNEGKKHFIDWLKIKDDNNIPRNEVSRILKKYTAQIFENPNKQICFHDLRHSYAINLLSSGVNLSLIALSLGNSIQVCQEYYVGHTLSSESIESIRKIVNKK